MNKQTEMTVTLIVNESGIPILYSGKYWIHCPRHLEGSVKVGSVLVITKDKRTGLARITIKE